MKIYTSTTCNRCKQVKAIMDKAGIEYSEVNIEEDFKAQAFLSSIGKIDLPVVEKDDGSIIEGGFTGIVKELNEMVK